MMARCNNPNATSYKAYCGGHGIKVCKRWTQFENFLTDMGERPEGHSLDRIKNNLGYSLSNCRWATRKEQSLNRRNVVLIRHEGRSLVLADWCAELGLKYPTVYKRLRRGVPFSVAITSHRLAQDMS